jgi:ribonuclease P protein component
VADSRPPRDSREKPRTRAVPSFARSLGCGGVDPAFFKGDSNEANVSAAQSQSSPDPWFPQADGNEGGARCYQEPPGKGPVAAHGDGLREVVPGASPVGRFDSAQRVKKRREFEAVQKAGRRVMLPHFVLLLYARDQSSVARLGIVASRKVGIAVTRNRAKRLAREAFRSTRDLFQPGIDLVVIVRRPLDNMKLADVVSEWRAAAAAVARRSVDAKRDFELRTETTTPSSPWKSGAP